MDLKGREKDLKALQIFKEQFTNAEDDPNRNMLVAIFTFIGTCLKGCEKMYEVLKEKEWDNIIPQPLKNWLKNQPKNGLTALCTNGGKVGKVTTIDNILEFETNVLPMFEIFKIGMGQKEFNLEKLLKIFAEAQPRNEEEIALTINIIEASKGISHTNATKLIAWLKVINPQLKEK